MSAVAAFVTAMILIPPTAGAQGFTNACGGTEFFSCLNLSIAASNSGTTETFTVTNVSNTGLGNNPNSFFTLIGIGSTGAGPTSMGTASSAFSTGCKYALVGCSKSSNNYGNGFSGAGFNTANFFGLHANSPSPTNGLHDGASVSFFLNFTTSGDATSFLNGLQLAIHDQGGLTDACGSSKVVFNANGSPTMASASPVLASSCSPRSTTTPEPSSMALLGTGLVGLVPMFRRRKQ